MLMLYCIIGLCLLLSQDEHTIRIEELLSRLETNLDEVCTYVHRNTNQYNTVSKEKEAALGGTLTNDALLSRAPDTPNCVESTLASFPGLPRGEGRPVTHCSRMRRNFLTFW